MPIQPIKNPQTEKYLHGHCHILAIALNRLTGFKIWMASTYDEKIKNNVLIHCWVALDDHTVLDASGLTTIEHSLQLYPDGDTATLSQVSPEELLHIGEGVAEFTDDVEKRIDEAQLFAKKLMHDFCVG